ncbi:T9SS type A sorting domain-containing protein [bacterium]|nr:T9SS type A sorting domain-containing protein [bacterium]
MSWKGLLGILLASLLATTAFAAANVTEMQADLMHAADIQKRADGMSVSLEIAAPEIADVPVGDGWGQVLEIPGGGMLQVEGAPPVPMLSRMFRMPMTGGAEAVVLDATYETFTGLEYATLMNMDGDEPIFGELDPSIDAWYPGTLAEVTDPAIARRFRIANLVTYPVQVNPYLNEVRVYSDIQVDIQYGGEGINELDSYPTRLSKTYLSFYEQFLDWDSNELDDFEVYRGGVQVVCKETAKTQLAEWIEWKRQKGYKLEFITDAGTAWSSSSIKAELQSRWDSSDEKFDWVVIVGDNGGIYSTPPGSGYGDHYYVKLEGNDELPEAGVGRISVESQTDLIAYKNKVMFYERDPYMDETGWYKRGMVAAGSASSGVSTIYLGRYARHAMLDIGYTQVDTAWYTQGGVNNASILAINAGVTFYNYRGYINTGLDPSEIFALTNYFKPCMVVHMTCGTGNWTNGLGKNEAWMRAGSVNEPTGGIGAISIATSSTHTRYNNALSGGAIFSNMVLRNPEMGGDIFWSKVNLYNAFIDHAPSQVSSFSEWTNLMGDPTVWLWTDIPQDIEVIHPSALNYGRHGFEIEVRDGNGQPVPDAWVCLYKNDAEDDTVAFGETDAMGRIVLDPEFIAEGMAKLTVTAQNFQPYRTDVPVEVTQLMAVREVQVIDNGQAGSQGNGNGLAEPGEIVGLYLTLHNLYPFTAPRIGAIFTTDDPMVEQTGGIARVGNIGPGQIQSATSLALMQIADDAQSGWVVDGEIGIGVMPQGGGQPNVLQTDVFTFKIHAPEYTYVNQDPAGTIVPGATVDIDLSVANIGLTNGGGGFCQLVSDDPYLTVNSGQIAFPAVPVGQTGTTTHTITAHPESFRGYPADAFLVVGNADGFRDSVNVKIQLGTATTTDPVGPDGYGYIAFDNRDTDYDIAPVFDWVEINPNVGGNDYDGSALAINDNGEEDDDAVVVDLPFTMKYYGVDFDQMTITCNGFVAMGNQGDMRTPRNWPIPSPVGPNYMIAPYWDDRMVDGQYSGVYHYYDEPNGRYIIEWYSVADVYVWSNPSAWNTFQMIVYDQVGEHITITGDNNILFQYEDVTHTTGESFDNAYATVGVENHDQTDGLQIAYWDGNDTPPNATICDGRAILITTQAALITGIVTGDVTFATGGGPVEGALVRTSDNAYFGYTDDQGHYEIYDVVIGTHDLVVELQGINPQTTEIVVEEGLITVQDFAVTAPEFELSVAEINEILPPGETTTANVVVSNPGDGELTWTVEMDNTGPNPEPDAAWDLLDEFQLTGPENRNYGITLHRGFYWVSGGNNNQNPNGLYRITLDGNIVQSYAQPVTNPSTNGFLCLTSDGNYIYGVDDGMLHQIEYNETTHDISLIDTIDIPATLATVNMLTYDHDNDVFWMGQVDGPIYAMNRSGNFVGSYDLDMTIRSLSYHKDDPDGYNLWFTLQETYYVDVTVMKMNTATGDTLFVYNIPRGMIAGLTDTEITYLWNPFYFTFIQLRNASQMDDVVEVYEISPNNAWMSLNTEGEVTPAGGDFTVEVSLASLDLPEGMYSTWLRFDNNTFVPTTWLPVTLTVDQDLTTFVVGEGTELRPLAWEFDGVYPNPFNPTATVQFSTLEATDVKAVLYNVLGQKVATLHNGMMNAGHHQLMINGDNMASGIYFLRFSAGPMQESRKVVLLR